MNKCGDCINFEKCKEYTDPNETYAEVGGCKNFASKMPNKLTDNDIKKALEDCIKHNGSCYECPSFEFCDKNDCKITMEMVLAYINRLEAEKSNLKETLDRVVGEVKGLRDTNKELQAENEKLKIRLRKEKYQFADIGKMYSEVKTEAYKEVFEKISDKSCVQEIKKGLFCKVVTLHDINTLKKEMVGEDNA